MIVQQIHAPSLCGFFALFLLLEIDLTSSAIRSYNHVEKRCMAMARCIVIFNDRLLNDKLRLNNAFAGWSCHYFIWADVFDGNAGRALLAYAK